MADVKKRAGQILYLTEVRVILKVGEDYDPAVKPPEMAIVNSVLGLAGVIEDRGKKYHLQDGKFITGNLSKAYRILLDIIEPVKDEFKIPSEQTIRRLISERGKATLTTTKTIYGRVFIKQIKVERMYLI